MRILITGDSHTAILRRGLAHLATQDAQAVQRHEIEIRALGTGAILQGPFFADRTDFAEILNPQFKDRFTRVPPEGQTLDWIGFSGPLHGVRFWRSDWSQHVPWNMAGTGARVSTGLLHRIIEDDIHHQLSFIQILKRSTRVFVVEPPWPFEKHRAIGSNGAPKVLALHALHREYIMRRLAALSVPVVTVDPSWITKDGFMDPALKSANPVDQHHGNDTFGAQMMERILTFIQAG